MMYDVWECDRSEGRSESPGPKMLSRQLFPISPIQTTDQPDSTVPPENESI